MDGLAHTNGDSKVVARVVVEMNSAGQINVNFQADNKVTILGMLELAKGICMSSPPADHRILPSPRIPGL